MSNWSETALALIAANPHWANLIVFAIAAAESIVLAGYIVPGTVILFGIGGIAAIGKLPLIPLLVWAALGAIVGDGFSYWLGRRYQDSLRTRWPFTRYPDLIDRGEAFFHRHGAKSVAIGRFVPVLKPIIPVVAGIVGMPPARFYLVNILSALVWSPAHILPGVLAGASLHLLQGVSPRLAGAGVVVALAIVAAWLLVRLLIMRTIPLINRLLDRLFAWSQQAPGSRLQRLGARFDPAHPATAALLGIYVLLFLALVGFVAVLANVLEQQDLVRADQAISTLVQGLRNPLTDPAVIAISSLGDWVVTTSVAVLLVGWLLWQRRSTLAATVGAAVVLTALSVPLMKALIQIPRPNAMYGFDAFFPSGHTTMTAAVYGLLAWIVAGGLRIAWRPAIYLIAGVWMVTMAVSRVYLGAHWPSDVIAGLCLGPLAPATVASLYHDFRQGLRPRALALAAMIIMTISGTWHLRTSWAASTERYLPSETPGRLDTRAWWSGQAAGVASHRIDLGGELEEPFVLQWLGREAVLRRVLVAAGWSEPPAWSISSATGYIRPLSKIAELPVTPRLADGRLPTLMLTRMTSGNTGRWILRAWPSGLVEDTHGRTLLLASIVLQSAIHPGQALTLTRSQEISISEARRLLKPALDDAGTGIESTLAGSTENEPIRAIDGTIGAPRPPR